MPSLSGNMFSLISWHLYYTRIQQYIPFYLFKIHDILKPMEEDEHFYFYMFIGRKEPSWSIW